MGFLRLRVFVLPVERVLYVVVPEDAKISDISAEVSSLVPAAPDGLMIFTEDCILCPAQYKATLLLSQDQRVVASHEHPKWSMKLSEPTAEGGTKADSQHAPAPGFGIANVAPYAVPPLHQAFLASPSYPSVGGGITFVTPSQPTQNIMSHCMPTPATVNTASSSDLHPLPAFASPSCVSATPGPFVPSSVQVVASDRHSSRKRKKTAGLSSPELSDDQCSRGEQSAKRSYTSHGNASSATLPAPLLLPENAAHVSLLPASGDNSAVAFSSGTDTPSIDPPAKETARLNKHSAHDGLAKNTRATSAPAKESKKVAKPSEKNKNTPALAQNPSVKASPAVKLSAQSKNKQPAEASHSTDDSYTEYSEASTSSDESSLEENVKKPAQAATATPAKRSNSQQSSVKSRVLSKSHVPASGEKKTAASKSPAGSKPGKDQPQTPAIVDSDSEYTSYSSSSESESEPENSSTSSRKPTPKTSVTPARKTAAAAKAVSKKPVPAAKAQRESASSSSSEDELVGPMQSSGSKLQRKPSTPARRAKSAGRTVDGKASTSVANDKQLPVSSPSSSSDAEPMDTSSTGTGSKIPPSKPVMPTLRAVSPAKVAAAKAPASVGKGEKTTSQVGKAQQESDSSSAESETTDFDSDSSSEMPAAKEVPKTPLSNTSSKIKPASSSSGSEVSESENESMALSQSSSLSRGKSTATSQSSKSLQSSPSLLSPPTLRSANKPAAVNKPPEVSDDSSTSGIESFSEEDVSDMESPRRASQKIVPAKPTPVQTAVKKVSTPGVSTSSQKEHVDSDSKTSDEGSSTDESDSNVPPVEPSGKVAPVKQRQQTSRSKVKGKAGTTLSPSAGKSAQLSSLASKSQSSKAKPAKPSPAKTPAKNASLQKKATTSATSGKRSVTPPAAKSSPSGEVPSSSTEFTATALARRVGKGSQKKPCTSRPTKTTAVSSANVSLSPMEMRMLSRGAPALGDVMSSESIWKSDHLPK